MLLVSKISEKDAKIYCKLNFNAQIIFRIKYLILTVWEIILSYARTKHSQMILSHR